MLFTALSTLATLIIGTTECILILLYLKCICNENFDFGIFTSSENFVFSDHFDTNLVAKFELEVCEFLVGL